MNERDLKILEQYDLKVVNTRRGRGSFICETDKGLKMVTAFAGSEKKLAFQNQVLRRLKEQGYEYVDPVMENSEGSLVTTDKYGETYIVKDWFEGRECDTRSETEVLMAVENLARIHRLLWVNDTEERFYLGEPREKEVARRNRELKKTRDFIRTRRGKNFFENEFLQCFPQMYEEAQENERQLRASDCGALYAESVEKGLVCHGDYNQHHVMLCSGGMATTNFGRCAYDVQAGDLCLFLRKILEKQNWDVRVGSRMLETYVSIRPLDARELRYLALRLSYPEKFWKLANQYYNHNKAWVPERNAEKLRIEVEQQKKRLSFAKTLE